MKYQNIIIGVIGITLLFGGFVYFEYRSSKDKTPQYVSVLQKCPDSYAADTAGSAEYVAATNKFTNDFFDSHPGASLSDWSKARVQFYKDNGCEAELKRYNDLKEGKGDTATVESVKRVKNEMIESL